MSYEAPAESKERINHLIKAVQTNCLGLMPATLKSTGETVDVICFRSEVDDDTVDLVPLAIILRTNLLDALIPPEGVKEPARDQAH